MIALLFILAVLFFSPSSVWAITAANITSSPSSIIIDTPFDIGVSIQGETNTSYYLKARIGVNTNSLTKGLTNNYQNSPPDDWLTDNDSWLKFPTAQTDGSGVWQGSIHVKASTTASLGSNLLIFRIRKVNTSENINSPSNIVTITAISPTPTPSSPTQSPTSTPAPSSTQQPNSSFTISNIPTQINSDQSFNVSVNLTLPNNRNTDYYLSGAFKKADGTRYFGLTKINSNWVKYESSNYLNQYKITTDNSGSWTGTLEVKPDTEDSDYKGTGDYIFKVSRYTANGSQTWSNESTIKIISTETDQSETLTNTASTTTNPSTSPSSIKTRATTLSQAKSYDRLVYHIASVAGATASATTSASSTPSEIKNQKKINPFIWIGLIFVFAGGSTLGYIYLKKNAKIHIPFGKRN